MVHFHKQIQCFFFLFEDIRFVIHFEPNWAIRTPVEQQEKSTSGATGWSARTATVLFFVISRMFVSIPTYSYDPNDPDDLHDVSSWFHDFPGVWIINQTVFPTDFSHISRIFPARLCLKYSQPKSIHGLSKTCGPIKTAVLEYPVSLDKPIGNSGNMWQHHVNTHTHM